MGPTKHDFVVLSSYRVINQRKELTRSPYRTRGAPPCHLFLIFSSGTSSYPHRSALLPTIAFSFYVICQTHLFSYLSVSFFLTNLFFSTEFEVVAYKNSSFNFKECLFARHSLGSPKSVLQSLKYLIRVISILVNILNI